MENSKVSSYSSAGVFPVKLFHCKEIVDKYYRIKPIHIQLNLTNKCNLSCSFCSCQNRTKNITLSDEKLNQIIDTYAKLGCQSVTLTGGGEPTLHPKINTIFKRLKRIGIKTGLVTNGIDIDQIKGIEDATWVRLSFDDTRKFDFNYKHNLISAVTNNRQVDWSFSYVVTKNPDYDKIIRVIQFANEYAFTHVRLVSDLLDLDNVPDMQEVKKAVSSCIVDNKVIYQSRQKYEKGTKNCLISLLKPVITAEGDIYPCCGTQYAKKSNMYDYDESMKMGTIDDVEDIFYKQVSFNGEDCDKCYYTNYNEALGSITSDINHKEFI